MKFKSLKTLSDSDKVFLLIFILVCGYGIILLLILFFGTMYV